MMVYSSVEYITGVREILYNTPQRSRPRVSSVRWRETLNEKEKKLYKERLYEYECKNLYENKNENAENWPRLGSIYMLAMLVTRTSKVRERAVNVAGEVWLARMWAYANVPAI